MSECLYCAGPITNFTTWKTLFFPKEPSLCDECEASFQLITGPICPICSRPQSSEVSCGDCRRWEEDLRWSGVLRRNYSLFTYNDAMKEWIASWKYRGDAVLAQAFQSRLQTLYRRCCDGAVPVPIPLSKERLQERGFNQSAILASFVCPPPRLFSKKYTASPREPAFLLERTAHEEKQSKKSRLERMSSSTRPFRVLLEKNEIEGKSFVIIDDIYTTGTTLRKAAEELRRNGAKDICSITLARG
ncbi:ComF family protein [Salibacterium aidingense]|uniref:ComF family protein n=1 Tax=Salibacterium aidingense TaxID=384933 RepID=UPI003BD54559